MNSSGLSDESRLPVAVIGCGRMGRLHARVYSQIPRVKLVGVYDANLEAATTTAAEYGGVGFATVDELLKHAKAVTIATPTVTHLDLATQCITRGVACLVEKPLAKDVNEARQIAALAGAHNVTVQVGHIERFNPAVRAMSSIEMVPRFMEVVRISPLTFRSIDVGVVLDMMIHDIDVVLSLMGGREPDRIRAAGVSVITPHEDLCDAWLEFDTPAGKCVANVTASRLAMKTERITRITGENAYIKIDYGQKKGNMIRRTANEIQMREMQEAIRNGTDLSTLKWDQLVNVEILQVDDAEPIVMEIREFIEAVRTGRKPSIDAEAGFANVRTAQRIVEAMKQ